MKNNYKFLLCVLIFGVLFFVTGCSNQDDLTMENKIEAEVEYVTSRVEIFLEKCEQNEYLVDGVFDWELLAKDNSVFVNSITAINDDLNYVKLDVTKIDDINNRILNINNYIQNKDYDNTRLEYAKLYETFENISSNNFKNIKVLAIQIYMNSIIKNDNVINLINSLNSEYKKIDTNELNFIELTEFKKIISDMNMYFNQKDFQSLEKFALELVEIL